MHFSLQYIWRFVSLDIMRFFFSSCFFHTYYIFDSHIKLYFVISFTFSDNLLEATSWWHGPVSGSLWWVRCSLPVMINFVFLKPFLLLILPITFLFHPFHCSILSHSHIQLFSFHISLPQCSLTLLFRLIPTFSLYHSFFQPLSNITLFYVPLPRIP